MSNLFSHDLNFSLKNKYLNAAMPDACPIMKSTNENDFQAQYEHLCQCRLCRMHRCSVDLHPVQGWSTSFSTDLMIEPMQKAFLSKSSSNPKFNNCPLVNRRYEVDNNGGFFLCPGKSSHSTTRVPRTHLVKFRDSAGSAPASCFLMLKLISNTPAGKGEIFVRINDMFKDADKILDSLKRFQDNTLPLMYFNKAVSVLKLYCRKAPNNIHPDDKPSACSLKLYNEIYNNSNLKLCTDCTNCTVNTDLVKITEYLILMYKSMNTIPCTKLNKILGKDLIQHFLTHCDVTPPHASLKANQNVAFPLAILE